MLRVTLADTGRLEQPNDPKQVLVVDAWGFRPEGVDPSNVLSCFLDQAHRAGWRKFIDYRVEGQRGIGLGMGSGQTFDTSVDVYGSPGEYCGAFNMGALVRVHGHAQNFTGMVMDSGTLEIHGDVGKVTGYSSKGGTFNILGTVVDRGWVCAVSAPRGPGLEVNIVGTAYEHLCQAFMGGSVMKRGFDKINGLQTKPMITRNHQKIYMTQPLSETLCPCTTEVCNTFNCCEPVAVVEASLV